MKIPEPRKLPSGAWNVRIMLDGESYSITKPTKKACLKEASALKTGIKKAVSKKSADTLRKAIDAYISARANVLSPSTIRGYKAIQKLRFQSVMDRPLGSITQPQWQRIVNQEAKLCSAKTLKNAWGFVSSVLMDSTGERISVRLPQVIANDLPFLTAEQIPTFLNAIRGEYFEVAILLGLSGLRRSEILAVRWKDIDLETGCIHVHGSAVMDADGNMVQRKENKNTSSRRTVPFLIPQLREAVKAAEKTGEFVVECYPNSIYSAVNRICRREGLPEIGAHGLRRSFASLCYHLNIPEQVTMKAGGWSDIYTMRKIYTKVSEKDISEHGQRYADFFANL